MDDGSKAIKSADVLPVLVVQAAQSDPLDGLVALSARVAVAVVAEDQASSAPCDDSVAADTALQRPEETTQTQHVSITETTVEHGSDNTGQLTELDP